MNLFFDLIFNNSLFIKQALYHQRKGPIIMTDGQYHSVEISVCPIREEMLTGRKSRHVSSITNLAEIQVLGFRCKVLGKF